jgi:hypothetical protein
MRDSRKQGQEGNQPGGHAVHMRYACKAKKLAGNRGKGRQSRSEMGLGRQLIKKRADAYTAGRNEPLSKYVERITTLFGEVEAHETLSMGEKLHRFKKGLREELQDKAIIDPGTGLPYDDLDLLINALTKYEAAMGGGQRTFKRTRMGPPSGQAAAVQQPQGQGQGQGLGQWDWQQQTMFQPPALQELAGVAGLAGLAAGQA